LPAGEQVFVAGDPGRLGQWRPAGFPLDRRRATYWSGSALVSSREPLEFKITRGTWDTERVLADGRVPFNQVLPPGGDEVVRLQAEAWKDHRFGAPPRITGAYRVHEDVRSRYLHTPRRVIVWLPPSYEQSSGSYPVGVMQDGQQVLDPQTSTHGQDWEVDEWAQRLMAVGAVQECLVAAVYSTNERGEEYDPARSWPEYVRFVVEELLPMLKAEYRVEEGAGVHLAAGSSMGAAVAFYLAWTHPDLFRGAACLSPCFDYRGSRACLDLVESAREPTGRQRWFLYCGRGDPLERQLHPGMKAMERALLDLGLQPGSDVLAVEDQRGQHHESDWSIQTEEWLRFFFGRGPGLTA
jgi:predicted alpha/beta superfamily hydrolase